jgi:hypothetical protein
MEDPFQVIEVPSIEDQVIFVPIRRRWDGSCPGRRDSRRVVVIVIVIVIV